MTDHEVLERLKRTAVRTDADVVDLVVALLDGPIRRQCWVLFLSDNGLPVQLALPISDLPYQPDEHVEDFAALVADLVDEVGAAQVVVVWERPGATTLHPVDWEWVDAVDCAFAEHPLRLRTQVVVHEDGASVVELDDAEAA